MAKKANIVWFDEVGKEDVGIVGGKGANLGEMVTAGFPIPYGFIVTSQAYFSFIRENDLDKKIKELLSFINFENPEELRQASSHIKELFGKYEISKELISEIMDRYEGLTAREIDYYTKQKDPFQKTKHKIKGIYQMPLVAVRSSATAEDLPDASFAGQQETYLNIRGEHHLIQKIRECWASLFTERAIYYRHQKGFDNFKVGLAAVVQRMVQSEKSGIAFSIDPVTNDKSKIVIEAIYGLGEYIVQGKVTPDHYEVDKRSFVILKKEAHYQNLKYIKKGTKNIEVKLSKKKGSETKLTDEELIKVAMTVKNIESHYFFPQDIEWAMENDRLFVVQSRPITTIKETESEAHKKSHFSVSVSASLPIVVGAPASPGIGVGPVKIINSPREIDKIKHGDVLVAPQTNPDYVPAMRKAVAIVTEKGGRTSHAAIVSRELGIPAVVGAIGATTKLKQDLIVTVNGATGEVFKGKVMRASDRIRSIQHKLDKAHTKKTRTKVYVNLAEPDQAEKIADLNVDGIGLLRAEFMIANIGTHPKEFIKQKKQEEFVKRLVVDLKKFVKAFEPRPVIYRATDFKTNEYKHLKGGEHFESKEENPMLGFRGAARYIADPQVFSLELEALRRIWDMGYKNLHLMIPFVRTPWELIRIKELIEDHGLSNLPGFKLWIMAEVPSCALNIEEFIKIGIDGVSIGTNDLTMMLLGVDRDNESVAQIYDERNPFVISALKYVVETCVKSGVTCSICGQAASDYPEVVRPLIEAGITSVSVNPDAVDRTRELIYNIEKHKYV